MFARKVRGAVIVLTMAALPAEQAQSCEFLKRCFGCGPSYTAAYAPACCPAPCPQPCPPQQCVSYMPQTCYRTVYCNVPVTSYCAMQTCDPCTGCPRTVMRPVTSYVAQARLVAYTAYRPVVGNCCPQPCATGCAPSGCGPSGCGPAGCGTAAYPSVAAYASYATPSSPSCCSPASTPYASAPASPSYPSAPAPQYGSPSGQNYSAPQASPTPAAPPQANPMQGGGAPSNSTFEQQPAANPGTQTQFQPLQISPPTYPTGAPRALDPEGQDRVTARPLPQAYATRPISTTTAVYQVSNDGWRAAN